MNLAAAHDTVCPAILGKRGLESEFLLLQNFPEHFPMGTDASLASLAQGSV